MTLSTGMLNMCVLELENLPVEEQALLCNR